MPFRCPPPTRGSTKNRENTSTAELHRQHSKTYTPCLTQKRLHPTTRTACGSSHRAAGSAGKRLCCRPEETRRTADSKKAKWPRRGKRTQTLDVLATSKPRRESRQHRTHPRTRYNIHQTAYEDTQAPLALAKTKLGLCCWVSERLERAQRRRQGRRKWYPTKKPRLKNANTQLAVPALSLPPTSDTFPAQRGQQAGARS